MQISQLFSLLFFGAFVVFLLYGISTLQLNRKCELNKTAFSICIALCLWTLGLSVATSAKDWGSVFLWRRIAALGWGAIPSLFLHLFLLITTERCTLKTWRCRFMLYLPAAVSVYAFGLSREIALTQYNLINTASGWIDLRVNSFWSAFFYVYLISYMITNLYLIFKWKRRNSHDNIIRDTANLFLLSVFSAFILRFFSDIALPLIIKSTLPQIAPLFGLFPVGVICFTIKHGGLPFCSTCINKFNTLPDEISLKMYNYIGLIFLVGGFSSIFSYQFPGLVNSQESTRAMFSGGAILFLAGISILLAQLISDFLIKDLVVQAIMMISIPLVTMQFVDYASITVWVFPIVLMVASLVFSSRKHLILLTVVSVATQILVWINAPEGHVYIDEFDYILRIVSICAVFAMGALVNKNYNDQIKDNVFQLNFQRLISENSGDFVTINHANKGVKFIALLERIGQFFHVDRTYIFLIDGHQNTMTYAYEWCNKGISPEAEIIQDVPVDVFPWWMSELSAKRLVQVEDVDDLPEAAATEKEVLKKQGVKSVLVLPIGSKGNMLGFVGLDSVVSKKKWISYHIEMLQLLSHLAADALIRLESEKTIESLAYNDHLTGLPNRVSFSDFLSQAVYQATRNNKLIAVLFLDLDGFKTINDTIGHSGGDALLVEISKRLVNGLDKEDTVSRFGGDEFIVLIKNLGAEKKAPRVADKVMSFFKDPFYVYGQEFYISASGGLAIFPHHGKNPETLIKNADLALYKAKERGKNQYAMFTAEMKEELENNARLSALLYSVLERDELFLHYQPQVRIDTGEIVGFEALLRWNHPVFGLVPPGVFIPLAETNGTISNIGEWVLKTAVQQNKKWQDKGFPPVRVSVNLSIVQFRNPNLVNRIISILEESGLEPKYLELEITETVASKDSDKILNTLKRLKDLGVSISIDDFGMEYSSLNRLKALPIDRIKIDMHFIRGIETSRKDQAITKIIINLAKSLGVGVLAEGVETAWQLEFLNQKKCDEVQGYYCYRPMTAGVVEKLFKGEMPENPCSVRKQASSPDSR